MITQPLVRIAHRGGGSLAPENSLSGIERSLTYNIEMIEVDVRRTLDGALVLSHDPAPHGSPIPIRTSTLVELQAGHGGITSLADAMDLIGGRARMNLDIKDEDIADDVAALVHDRGAADWCIVSCLDAPSLARFTEIAPHLPRFLSYPRDRGGASTKGYMKPAVSAAVSLMRLTLPRRLRGMIAPLPGTGVTAYYKLLTPRLVAMAHGLGASIYTWTIDDLDEMHRAVALGVDGITSNRPDLLAQLGAAPAVRSERA